MFYINENEAVTLFLNEYLCQTISKKMKIGYDSVLKALY